MRPGVVGLANALGVDRIGMYSIVSNRPFQHNGTMIRLPDETRIAIKRAYTFIEQQWEDSMTSGRINPASGIFLGKNNYGYTDVQEHVLTPAPDERKVFDTDSIGQRYLADEIDSDGTVE